MTMLSMLLGQCGGKVAELSFADSSELRVEVREKFGITVNVKNIDMDNIDDDLDWDDIGTPSADLQQKKMYVILKVVKNGTRSAVAQYSHIIKKYTTRIIHEASIENGMASFKGLYFTEVCDSNCQIIASLRIYGHACQLTSATKHHEYDDCNKAQVEPVDEISRRWLSGKIPMRHR